MCPNWRHWRHWWGCWRQQWRNWCERHWRNPWWQRRRGMKAPRVALYYNTISLHDGNRLPEAGGWLRSYPRRARRLLDDLDRFIAELESSGAHAIVVVIPEHGAAYHATPGGIAGLRQMPGPDVTRVPVGVRLVGLPVAAA